MTTSEQMFLYVVEEMSFTKAAEKHFISQQAVSGHIRKLEEDLDTRLFVRSPRLRLTEAGQMLYRSLLKIRRIEQHTRESIADSSRQVHGRVVLGIQSDRSHILMPALYPRYHALYPNVTVSLISGHTPDFLEQLEAGQLDLMIGHDTAPREGLLRETVFEEAVYLLATRKFLASHLPDWNDERQSIDSFEIQLLPLTCTSFNCAVMNHVDRFFAAENLQPQYLCEVGDYMTQLLLCLAHETAFFCPESAMLQQDFRANLSFSGDDRVLALPVRHMDSRIRVELISRNEDYLPGYIREFRRMLLEEYRTLVRRSA